MMAKLQVKRIYDTPTDKDGFRVLIDRLWPRGVSRERADIDLWLKDIAPSTQARTEFGHRPEKFAEFTARYRAELDHNAEAVATALQLLREHGTVTLLIAARDPECNHGIVLREYLAEAFERAGNGKIS
ncbi:DUF488 domain-containing protein [Populibacterium corticicola]|uniref:DUF488 domain-containing protein n=2 Tax=Populibacterium corticicola TaxID=1812826 RepID=A0ABW5XCM7_9MICO